MTQLDATYGSDASGLVWGFHFAPDEPPRSVDSDEAAAMFLASANAPPGRFIWLHFSLSNAAAKRWLRERMTLPDEFLASLGASTSSTRLEQIDDSLIAVLHDVLFEFAFDPEHVSTVGLCVQESLVVSARLRPLRSIDRLRAAIRAGTTFRSPAEMLAHLLRDQADVLVEIVRNSTARVDAVEDSVLRGRVSVSRAELGALRRLLVRLQRLLAPEPAALFRLMGRPPRWIDDEDQRDLRQAAEEFSAAVADCAALVERVRLNQEELASLINEQNNRILFLLTVVTVLALPFNVIAGLLGMNVGGIPFSRSPFGFAVIVAFVVVLTVAAATTFRRWLDSGGR